MTAYAWTCLACGGANPPAATACGACACPARATVAELEAFRTRFEQAGGRPSEAATRLHEAPRWPSPASLLSWTAFVVFLVLPIDFAPMSPGAIVLAFLALWIVALSALKHVAEPLARAAIRAGAFALTFSPGLLAGHGIGLAPAAIAVFHWPLPNAASIVVCYLAGFAVLARSELARVRTRPRR